MNTFESSIPASEQGPEKTQEELFARQQELLERLHELAVAQGEHQENNGPEVPIGSEGYRDFGFQEQIDEIREDLQKNLNELAEQQIQKGRGEGRPEDLILS